MNAIKQKSPMFAASSFQKDKMHNQDIINLIFNLAKGRWVEILESMSINASYLKDKHGPCPGCGGKDRFRFDDKGKGRFFCNKFGSGNGIQLLQHCYGFTFSEACRRLERILRIRSTQYNLSQPKHARYYLNALKPKAIEPCQDSQVEKKRKRLLKTWKASRPVTFGDPVDCYLKSRGIRLNHFPAALRFHPALPYFSEKLILTGKFPAMLGVMTNLNNNGITIHRTYLGDNCKAAVPAPKKMMSPVMPSSAQGAVVKLYEPVDGILAIGEGIETCLAFHVATGAPVWAAITAGGMEKVVLPGSVSDVVILVDNDISGRGQKAASILSRRLRLEGRKVRCVIPPVVGMDFNDMILGGSQ